MDRIESMYSHVMGTLIANSVLHSVYALILLRSTAAPNGCCCQGVPCKNAKQPLYYITFRCTACSSLPSALYDSSFSRKADLSDSDEHDLAPLWHFCHFGTVCTCHDLLTYCVPMWVHGK